jgi:hypothetical protein
VTIAINPVTIIRVMSPVVLHAMIVGRIILPALRMEAEPVNVPITPGRIRRLVSIILSLMPC